MPNIFSLKNFRFPYDYRFPGQATDERILFVTRENKLILLIKQLFVLMSALLIVLAGFLFKKFILSSLSIYISWWFEAFFVIIAIVFGVIGWWWVTTIWMKSIAMVTTKRLIKFIYTTPASHHSLVLPLEMIVDTGAYTKGFIQTFLKLETFIARSSASSSGVATDDTSRVNRKYFYIENIQYAEDLQHYLSKLLEAHRVHQDQMSTFRPFLPFLKGEARAHFIKENYPQFWS
ncbi:MAG TPA: hypothetical protein PLM16_02010 [Candidatus Woesebacteria bacterium]|nr:hypothetical protein [Candidatus Woesebacteria bacterium]